IKLDNEADRISQELDNKNFTERAPQPVIESKKQRLADVKAQIRLINDQMVKFKALLDNSKN
ncbi:MAG: hypothetical protein ACRESK_10575, partial [Gammaproteobacteria bacterium]